jgi:hypothetical protein
MKQFHIDSTQQIERGLKRGRFFEKLEQVVFFFVLLTAVSTTNILSSAVILQYLKDFHQEDSQKNNLFLKPIILKTPKSSISDHPPSICEGWRSIRPYYQFGHSRFGHSRFGHTTIDLKSIRPWNI